MADVNELIERHREVHRFHSTMNGKIKSLNSETIDALAAQRDEIARLREAVVQAAEWVDAYATESFSLGKVEKCHIHRQLADEMRAALAAAPLPADPRDAQIAALRELANAMMEPVKTLLASGRDGIIAADRLHRAYDGVRDLLRAAAPLPAETGWRPIETAPKDRWIDITDGQCVPDTVAWGGGNGWLCVKTDLISQIEPKYWAELRPLPAPPTTEPGK